MNENREAWLAERRKGIGGSDVAAALGISPWTTPVQLWQTKRGEGEPEKSSDSMHFGSILEDVVAKEFQDRTGMRVQRVNQTLRGPEDWMLANIDRAVINPDIAKRVFVLDELRQGETGLMLSTDTILECKTASAYTAGLWGDSQEDEIKAGCVVTEHKIPLYYETQVQWYLHITGAKVCYVAVLIGGNDFRMYRVDRSDAAIEAIVNACRRFWFEYVVAGKTPEPVNIDDIRRLYKIEAGPMIECSNEAATAIGEYRNIKAQIDGLTKQKEAVAAQIAGFIGEAEGLMLDGKKCATFKAQSREMFDSKKLKADDPSLWVKYVGRTEPSRVLRVY